MNDKRLLNRGDACQIVFTNTAIGFLYDENENEVFLSTVKDVTSDDQVKMIRKENLVRVTALGEGESIEPKQRATVVPFGPRVVEAEVVPDNEAN